MTPEGYEKIEAALGKNYWVSPRPRKGQNLPFVTIGNKLENSRDNDALSPAAVLNALADATLLHGFGFPDRDDSSPRLEVEPGMLTHRTVTFRDTKAASKPKF